MRIRPTWPIMQLAAALPLLLLSTAMVSIAINRRRLGVILTLPAVVVAGGAILEYLTGLPLGVQHAFERVPGTHQPLTPGAMAQGTAVVVIAGAIAVWLLARPRQQPILVAVAASIPMVIGSVSVFAHTLAVDTLHAPHPLLQLSFHTATASTLLSVGLLAHDWRVSRAQEPDLPRWVPISTGVMLSLVTLLLRIAVRDPENIVRFEEASTANPGAAA